MDPGLNSLLKWGIENSDKTQANGEPPSTRGISAEALQALMGGPSDADLMKEAMHIIKSPDATPEARAIAFDNFEQLVENIDNANNLEPLGLWMPLVEQLSSPEAEMRMMAAWCIGTAVQNNDRAQDRLLAVNGIPKLCKLAQEDEDPAVRRKCIYALSSEIRNYQPGMNEAVKYLAKELVGSEEVSATDMNAIDAIMAKLRGNQ